MPLASWSSETDTMRRVPALFGSVLLLGLTTVVILTALTLAVLLSWRWA